MGIDPTYPSEKYGYIIPTSEAPGRQHLHGEARHGDGRRIHRRAALWNGGVFAYKLGYVLDKAHELIDFTDYNDLYAKYESLKKISFDYAVVEHETHLRDALRRDLEGSRDLEHPDRGDGGPE